MLIYIYIINLIFQKGLDMKIIMPASEVMIMCETALERYHAYYEHELQQHLQRLRKPKRTWLFGKKRTMTYDEAVVALNKAPKSYNDAVLRSYLINKTAPTINKINRIYELCALVEKTTNRVILTEDDISMLTHILLI